MNEKPISVLAVYAALLIIVALGAVMFFSTYRLIIALTALFLTSGNAESVVSASYTLQVASMCGAIVLGGAGLILLPIGERYLRRKAALHGSLLHAFLRVAAGQLVYVVVVFVLGVLL